MLRLLRMLRVKFLRKLNLGVRGQALVVMVMEALVEDLAVTVMGVPNFACRSKWMVPVGSGLDASQDDRQSALRAAHSGRLAWHASRGKLAFYDAHLQHSSVLRLDVRDKGSVSQFNGMHPLEAWLDRELEVLRQNS